MSAVSKRETVGIAMLFVLVAILIGFWGFAAARCWKDLDDAQRSSRVLYGNCLNGDLAACKSCANECYFSEDRHSAARILEPRVQIGSR